MYTETICTCDIRNCNNISAKSYKIQVIFKTDQTEGKPSEPYLNQSSLDICDNCYNYILKGNYVHAYGAQGNNIYYLEGNV